MTKSEMKQEYNELWALSNNTMNDIRDTDTYTKDNKYYEYIGRNDHSLYCLGGSGSWRMNKLTKTELAKKIILITEQLGIFNTMLTQQLAKIN